MSTDRNLSPYDKHVLDLLVHSHGVDPEVAERTFNEHYWSLLSIYNREVSEDKYSKMLYNIIDKGHNKEYVDKLLSTMRNRLNLNNAGSPYNHAVISTLPTKDSEAIIEMLYEQSWVASSEESAESIRKSTVEKLPKKIYK